MRILSVNEHLITEVPFLNAGRGPGRFYVDKLPVHEAFVDRLPDGVCAIVVTADLQGRECFNKKRDPRPPRLLGEVLPRQLVDEILPDLSLPKGRLGALLGGDFYTVPALDKRGGSGDVSEVWRAFGDKFDWVAGVAGNHDTFGDNRKAIPNFASNLHYLDEDRVSLEGLQVGGVSGVIGNPKRLQRRTEERYLQALQNVLEEPTDILLMHDGPNAPEHRYRGNDKIREVIELLRPTLVVRGHSHWPEPFAELESGTQVLNVDARVVILRQ